MAIDPRVSRAKYPDRNRYYKGKYVNKTTLVQTEESYGVFYSQDVEPFTESVEGTGAMMKRVIIGKIRTNDAVVDLEPNDYVFYNDRMYRVATVTRKDRDSSKRFGRRPSAETVIEIRR